MKYIDKDGDTWQAFGDADGLVCIARANGTPAGGILTRSAVEEVFGPLRSVEDVESKDAASDGLPRVTDVLDRAAVFRSAHALVWGMEWGEGESLSVYDVLSVAKWLEGDE
ncbi:hypothetical protein ACIP88_05100 [Streptomyces uncialis]|uniref:hypothetical protein n=1 Tax=Streptomyces uncialis TaxID=1048205 RepID=UPI0037F1D326